MRCVGFDLDGTLYDEFDFIDQVYQEIIRHSHDMLSSPDDAGRWMRQRWLEKGSSYTHVFGETFTRFGRPGVNAETFIDLALDRFRHFQPGLQLPRRSRQVLEGLCGDYHLFLVSDGNPGLQRRKFAALGLDRWFGDDNCVFTGEHGADWHKPSPRALEKLALPHSPQQWVYIGDRARDKGFAEAARMHFVRVYNMIGRKQ